MWLVIIAIYKTRHVSLKTAVQAFVEKIAKIYHIIVVLEYIVHLTIMNLLFDLY